VVVLLPFGAGREVPFQVCLGLQSAQANEGEDLGSVAGVVVQKIGLRRVQICVRGIEN
jgi:hypothetical protein